MTLLYGHSAVGYNRAVHLYIALNTDNFFTLIEWYTRIRLNSVLNFAAFSQPTFNYHSIQFTMSVTQVHTVLRVYSAVIIFANLFHGQDTL